MGSGVRETVNPTCAAAGRGLSHACRGSALVPAPRCPGRGGVGLRAFRIGGAGRNEGSHWGVSRAALDFEAEQTRLTRGSAAAGESAFPDRGQGCPPGTCRFHRPVWLKAFDDRKHSPRFNLSPGNSSCILFTSACAFCWFFLVCRRMETASAWPACPQTAAPLVQGRRLHQPGRPLLPRPHAGSWPCPGLGSPACHSRVDCRGDVLLVLRQ